MVIDNEILDLLLRGLNELENGKPKFSIEGLNISEALEIEEDYLTNYQVNKTRPKELSRGYILTINKNK